MIPNRDTFSISFPELPRPVSDVWDTIVTILKSSRCLPKKFSLSQIAGHPLHVRSERDLVLTPEEIRQLIIDRDLDGFRVQTNFSERGMGFRLFNIQNIGTPASLSMILNSKTKTPPTWKPLIEALLVQWPSIGAWQWNTLYQAWQFCSEVKSLEMFFGGVPPKSRRYIEPPIDKIGKDREMVDLSLNPGRFFSILPAINFFPTAEMWLGPHFWQYAKCTKEEAMVADFFLEVRDTPHFLYLKSWPEPFTRPDGAQGRQQQRIWKLFFHEDCEWPPGSGGICDEPIYGPPELMP